MASLTIRRLDDDLKQRLRLRAARNGRSMEDEARIVLGEATHGEDGESSPGLAMRRRLIPRGPAKPEQPVRTAAVDHPSGSNKAVLSNILLVIGGGIAAYKSLDLIRRLKERGLAVRCILTKAAEQFVTPLSVGAILGERVFTDLFDAGSEFDVGHIRLARETDLIVVAPATADLMAKMAGGIANDLATAVLLAAGTKILLAPAIDRKSTRLNSSHYALSRMPSSA